MKRFSFILLVLSMVFCQSCAMVFCQGVVENSGNTVLDPKVIPVKTQQPEENKVYPIAVIGAGAAGSMAVNRAVLNNNEVLLFAGAIPERKRSRGNWVRKVNNVPGLAKYNRTVLELRNDTLEDLMKSPLAHNLYVIEDSIYAIEKNGDIFTLTDASGRIYHAKYVVMATGIMDEQPNIQGSIYPVLPYANGQTIVYCAVCDGHRTYGKKTVVLGHSEDAGYIALFLAEKYRLTNTTILTNGRAHEFPPELLSEMRTNNIAIAEAPILEVLGNKEQKQLTGFKLDTGEIIDAEIGLVALGIRPNNRLALQLGAKIDKEGLVIAKAYGETSVPGMFVIGDLRSGSMKQIYTAWQQSVETMQEICQRICEPAQK
jgi:thioredoxin reductase (NADPH)